MNRPLPSANRWALAAAFLMAAGTATQAQVVTADVKPGESSGEILLTNGPYQGPKVMPYQSDSMPLGCYGCMMSGGGGGGSSCGGGCGGGCGDGGCGGPG